MSVARVVGAGRPSRWADGRRSSRIPSREAFIDDYRLTRHALKQALGRRIDVDDLRKALYAPAVTRPETPKHLLCQEYGSCRVVLDPATREIITVMNLDS